MSFSNLVRHLAQRNPLRVVELGLVALSVSSYGSVAIAQIKFYYDPATGNVSFDTAGTRTGSVRSYGFSIWDAPLISNLPFQLRPENQIRLSNSSLYLAWPTEISEVTLTDPWVGLFTIGDILPPGLSEQEWKTSFKYGSGNAYYYNYGDAVGQGPAPPATFIYGKPDREFDNKWDLVDPATLTWATTAKLIYRAWSGEVLLDTTGEDSGYISYLLMKSSGAFLPEGYTPFTNSFANFAEPDAVYLAGDAIEPGQYSLGQILQAGLSATEFENLFTEARFIGRAGFNGGSVSFATDGVAMSLQFVPEPSAVLLAALACLGVCGVRRR